MQTSCGSRILGDYHPPYNATVIQRLIDAGAIIIGKTNCDEFAMGSSNENSAFGPVKNPWDVTRVSGGSSAAQRQLLQPASFPSRWIGHRWISQTTCFLVRRSRAETHLWAQLALWLVAFASSLDQVGVFAREVTDVARVLGVIAGRDQSRCDNSGYAGSRTTWNHLTGDVKGLACWLSNRAIW